MGKPLVSILLLAVAACAATPDDDAGAPRALASEEGRAPTDLSAAAMTATIYDDGIACPGDCDAHVVFHESHNGTANAYAPPLASRAAPQKCVNGETCVICFGAPGDSCMLARYRGSGPPRGRFDLTPAFYDEHCGETGIPPTLKSACDSLSAAARSRGYDVMTNCIAEPQAPACAAMMAAAEAERVRDAAERATCLAMGQAAYNAQQADQSLHRTNACNYYLNRRRSNSAGETWFKLAPGSCRPATYVGRDGLDCCSASLFAAAALHPECRSYYVE